MSKLYSESECVNHFLSEVVQEIQCKPVRAEIEKELKEHIEDSALERMEEGDSAEVAFEKAVKQMGDPSVIGVELNDAYSIQNTFLIYVLAGVSVLFGILSNYWYGYGINYSFYFIWGIIVLLGMVLVGYRILVKHTKFVTWIGVLLLVIICSRRTVQLIPDSFDILRHIIRGSSYGYNLIFLLLPIFILTLYRKKSDKSHKLILPFLLILLPIVIQYFYYYKISVISAYAILILASIITYVVMVIKGYFAIGRKKASLLGTCCFAVILLSFIVVFHKDSGERTDANSKSVWKESITLMLNPEKNATSTWQDGYNGVLIKELLSRAELVGEIKLTNDEMMEYGSGDWYFELEEEKRSRIYLHYDVNDVTLEKILPQHYHNNYRVTYIILKYGWCAGIFFLAALWLIIISLFQVTMRIRNRLGFSLALSGAVLITLQIIFYTLGNFGYQFGNFCNLPFISEGLMSITVNMILLSLIISAYRYDRVIDKITKKKNRIINKNIVS